MRQEAGARRQGQESGIQKSYCSAIEIENDKCEMTNGKFVIGHFSFVIAEREQAALPNCETFNLGSQIQP